MDYYELRRFKIDKKHPSLNMIYSSKHWTARSKAKNEWRNIFIEMLKVSDIRKDISKYEIDVISNNNYDVDNDIMLVKFFNDSLVSSGFVKDDNRRYFKGFSIHHSDELEKYNAIINLYYK